MNKTYLEEFAEPIAKNISSAVEIVAAVVIAVAVLLAIKNYFTMFFIKSDSKKQRDIRVEFGSSVAIALELLLGADVLATAVAPTWDDIGKLAAIATIRTALNYFLERDLKGDG
ncbi:DUF1622 domain-containing protein [Rubrolithibacter danxiaensis]|uniref:DUF1622 domain-containing protein n=1 Tax=Rubrolithibacter danxiaensis TaxID=3390805 RepID=UPI003BF8E8BD